MEKTETGFASNADWRSLLDCPLCLQTLSNPVATACGHTFCSQCLSQALASSPQCPLCRAPCYLQPTYSHGRKPVVLIEKIIEMAYGKAKPNQNKEDANKQTGPFRLGLFFLNEKSFFTVPNTVLKLRAYEPYVILLVRRCVEHGVRLGIQKDKEARHGLLVRVDKVAPFPDRFHSNHLLVQCFVEGLYTVTSSLQEEPSTGGLHYAQVEEINMNQDVDDPDVPELASTAKSLFELALKDLDPADVAAIFEDVYSGTMRVVPDDPVELSFFLIEALQVPNENEIEMLYEPSVKKRLEKCILLLSERNVEFRRVSSRRMLVKSRETLDFSRNMLLASGLMIFLGVALGGFDSLMQMSFSKRQ